MSRNKIIQPGSYLLLQCPTEQQEITPIHRAVVSTTAPTKQLYLCIRAYAWHVFKWTYRKQIPERLQHGYRTAQALCSVKHGEGLIIITGLDTGADPELSLARTLSGTHTYTHKLASTHARAHTPYKPVIKHLPQGEKKNAHTVS